MQGESREATEASVPSVSEGSSESPASSARPRRRRRTIALGAAAGILALAVGAEVAIHEMRVRASEQGSTISNIVRERWGNQRATQIEQFAFAYDSLFVTTTYWAGEAFTTGPTAVVRAVLASEPPTAPDQSEASEDDAQDLDHDMSQTSAVSARASLRLPELIPLNEVDSKDDGYWITDGLPNRSALDPVVAETWIHPRRALPKALVHVLLFDTSRVTLHMVAGTRSPGADRDVVGPGRIPDRDRPSLLAAWNGGFQGTHAPDYGMFADGKEYRPLNAGLATVVAYEDGRIAMGQWGRDFKTRTPDMVAIRQNSVLIVDGGEVSPVIKESVKFGLVNIGDTQNFITWRSAIGLTADGDLLVATGDYIDQTHMARCIRAAGAQVAMLMDNNLPYVQTVLASRGAGEALTLRNTRLFMRAQPDRYLAGNYAYDFMYLTDHAE